MDKHQKWMHQALVLAEKGRGNTSPNPMVGAVLVNDNQIVGEGYHQKFGGPHAEVWAIEQAGGLAKGSTLYVSLEPCSHIGKTPPCAQKIIDAGIKEVYISMIDPNPLVNGSGVRMLQDAGINVTTGLLESEARQINRGFINSIEKKRPWITLKMAQTADGYIADITGKSQWISSSDARDFVMQQRTIHDAIMVGMGTVFKDDPGLLPVDRGGFIPYRVILDDMLKIPPRLKLVSDECRHRTVILTASDDKNAKIKQLTGTGVNVIHVPGDSFGWIDLQKTMEKLVEFGITSIYSEGGSQVAGSLIQHDLVDEIQLIIAPKVLGEGISTFSGFMKSLDSAIQLKWDDVQMLGQDLLIRGRLA
ncbi:MAG: bifunctional diaminohydroxyphosphoribosylaminopyrimidine deaminase/5-amino-6-(5-phosphoribosylamino)uracil reductase RibD [Candidatus Marinimicrobia bacterium]|nr:bifunctional diaminohydroxyphosphoribosylaminopyrimidine deaminase/5-amino-6-(5-phosphoribosylamino)uracil reductase RibD [Candidatus Neomarinimicrobiota bacterium]